MKRFHLYIFAALAACSLASCTKDFLDREPISQALPHELNAESLLSGAYNGLYDEYYTSDFMAMCDVRSDNAYAGGDNPNIAELDKFSEKPVNQLVQRDWAYIYKNIKNTNVILSYVPEIVDNKLSGERRNEILGEAAYLRAWHYFNLVRLWGEVPIVLVVPDSVEGMFESKKPVEAVYQQIIADLEYALPKVRTEVDNKGIVSKGAVNALLAKVYAQKPNPDWTKVGQYCDAVTALGYDLVADYASLFQTSGENSKEAIWEIQFDGTQHQNWITGMMTPWMWGDWKKFYIPSHDLEKAFNDENDVIRKNASIRHASTSWTDDYWKQPVALQNKYPDPDGKSNTHRLRYADVLLLKAESLVETNKIAEGMDIVNNRIRKRVNLPAKAAADLTAARLVIEKERRLELAFEGHRWYDLLRTGRAVAVMNIQKDGDGNSLNYNVTTNKLYLPIPQDEVDRNPNINK